MCIVLMKYSALVDYLGDWGNTLGFPNEMVGYHVLGNLVLEQSLK